MKNLSEILLGRREFLLGIGALGSSCMPKNGAIQPIQDAMSEVSQFQFDNLPPILDQNHHVANGYQVEVLLRWGDPLFPNMAPFDWKNLDATEQEKRFGYNNDFLALFERDGKHVLVVNHESTSAQLMFEGQEYYTSNDVAHAAIEMMAHGLSVVELHYQEATENAHEQWSVRLDSSLNRRITAHTPMNFSGLVAGHPRLQTPEDPEGQRVLGTIHNCSGGVTPWGTVLTCEENILYYFRGEKIDEAESRSYQRYNIGHSKAYLWNALEARWDLSHAPKQPNRYGWVVEINPWDPNSTPIKRTSLGRFYHESANPIVNKDGRIVIYMGDDGYFEYLYRYVSSQCMQDIDASNPDNFGRLLDDGTLSVARFDENGTITWIPLRFGEMGLTPENGFASQADILIDARLAGDQVGATPMDRVEDVEPNPFSNRVYLNCTKNQKRGVDGADISAVAPRVNNIAGHCIELIPPEQDHTAEIMNWEILFLAGDDEHQSDYGGPMEEDAFLACPDNAAIDPQGRLWITTDGSNEVLGVGDGLYAVETQGLLKGRPKRLFSSPIGAEVTGPCFTEDGRFLFLSVQHPDISEQGFVNRWPDFQENLPPRPSIVILSKEDGGIIGGKIPSKS